MEQNTFITDEDIQKLNERLSQALGKLNILTQKQNQIRIKHKKELSYIARKLHECVNNFESIVIKDKV